ncbi:tRNA (adenine(22)-N(1))-methyltransferase [Anaerocellum diazotrophicum]|uniref:SAM-dependent methyltransferase n=1 Tax=Caldicellulosiruptor diazotrophicus TaxID=2806205 RepID=A0ABM7NLH9_9FIRM|nr:class I SAM-dependent methyltransferase [Caldicellulosiruptor diazotrophicus]BCS80953.1 SAM-dependent methyltransferase [Caldicellulosiruptor diazotrophicus]
MISKRIEGIINLLDRCNTLADIGCDHGYVAVEAIKRKIANKVFAVDINFQPLLKAKELSKKENVDDKIEFLLGNGFDPIEEEVDEAVIAGMGSENICSILSKAKDRIFNTTLVLQPMKDVELLRRWLFENGFDISIEKVIKDKNRFYIIIKSSYLQKKISFSDKDIYIGRHIHDRTEESYELLLKMKEKMQKIMGMKKRSFLDTSYEEKVLTMIEEELKKW